MSASTVIVAINARLLRLKTEPKPDAEAEPKTGTEQKPEGNAKPPSDLTQQISKRAYELYDARRGGVQDWDEAEREIRKNEIQVEPIVESTK